MTAEYTCEQCFKTYDDEARFVQCRGDACHELVCLDCAKKCKDPECKDYVCSDCRHSHGHYLGDVYCIKHAMFHDDASGNMKNFDYVARRMTRKKASAYLEKTPQHILNRLK